MKRFFLTGLVILLPIALTATLVIWIMNLITEPFVGYIDAYLTQLSWHHTYQGWIHLAIKIFLLFSLFFLTVLLGFLARIYIFNSCLKLYDYILHRIPIIKSVYKVAQQIITTILGPSSQSFKQVVLVRFPKEGSYCMGFITGNAPKICSEKCGLGNSLLTVYVPTTPNPTSGFLMMYPEADVIYLDMKVEEAFKYIVSCGVITQSAPPVSPAIVDQLSE